uniref:Uncharacterized protein n=1 Tax=Ditylenchus dipsaci TaxID=166011 RepID=A0A915D8Z5_9BILA
MTCSPASQSPPPHQSIIIQQLAVASTELAEDSNQNCLDSRKAEEKRQTALPLVENKECSPILRSLFVITPALIKH